MSVISRQKTWIPGDILTASDLNTEFNTLFNDYNGSVNLSNIDQTIVPTWTAVHTFTSGITTNGVITANAGIRFQTAEGINDDSGNEQLLFNKTGTAVNYWEMTNAAANGLQLLQATGSDTNVSGVLQGKGTGVIIPALAAPGVPINMKLSLSAGTFSVVGHNGSALSATNPGFVYAKNTSGGFSLLTFTSSPSFQDDAHATDSDFVGSGTMSWGTTAAVAWANDMPFLLGVCTDGTTPIMVIGRVPSLTTGANTNIGYWDTAPSSASQTNVFALTTTNVTVTHASQAITWIGSFRMTKSASDDWTVTAFDSGDGIGSFYNFGTRYFTFPKDQHGGGGTAPASDSHLQANGGTAAEFTTESFTYSVDMSGLVLCTIYYDGDGGGNGAGSVATNFAVPFAPNARGLATTYYPGAVQVDTATTLTGAPMCFALPSASDNNIKLVYNSSATAVAAVEHAMFSNGARLIYGSVSYPLA